MPQYNPHYNRNLGFTLQNTQEIQSLHYAGLDLDTTVHLFTSTEYTAQIILPAEHKTFNITMPNYSMPFT
jgi:hypothetical protein